MTLSKYGFLLCGALLSSSFVNACPILTVEHLQDLSQPGHTRTIINGTTWYNINTMPYAYVAVSSERLTNELNEKGQCQYKLKYEPETGHADTTLVISKRNPNP